MLDYLLNADPLALWGAVIATLLALIKLWETFVRDRTQLETTYSWTSLAGDPDFVTIANHGNRSVMIRHWSLTWERRWLGIIRRKTIDVTPEVMDNSPTIFVISPSSTHSLIIHDADKFNWTKKEQDGFRLYISLKLFGRKSPLDLRVV